MTSSPESAPGCCLPASPCPPPPAPAPDPPASLSCPCRLARSQCQIRVQKCQKRAGPSKMAQIRVQKWTPPRKTEKSGKNVSKNRDSRHCSKMPFFSLKKASLSDFVSSLRLPPFGPKFTESLFDAIPGANLPFKRNLLKWLKSGSQNGPFFWAGANRS